MAVPPENGGIMAESVQCFTQETACHQCQSLSELCIFYRLSCSVGESRDVGFDNVSLCVLTQVSA